MGIYNPKRRTEGGTEEIKFPKSSIDGLNDTINAITDIIGGLASNNDSMVGTWVFNDNPELPSESFAIKFTDGLGTEYGAIDYSAVEVMFYYSYELGNFDVDAYFGFSGGEEWAYEEAKIINILEEPSTEAASWIKANAVKQSSGSASLETEAQNIIGAINEINAKRLDKAESIIIANTSSIYADPEEGIFVDGTFYANKDDGNTDIIDVTLSRNIPIVPGENITFSVEGNVVKMNASGGGTEIVTTTGTGAAYIATVDSITELKAGVNFIMIPHTNSTTLGVTLNVNGLGAKTIMRALSGSAGVAYPKTFNFFKSQKPYRVIYDGTYWILEDNIKSEADDLYGRVPVANGGVPSSTSSNAGQVLTVNDSGTPAWATSSSSGDSGSSIRTLIGSEWLEYTKSKDGTYAICTGLGTCTDSNVKIASSYGGLPVEEIADGAFSSDYYDVSRIVSITVPNSVKTIGTYFVENCENLRSVFIPKSVTFIDAYAFVIKDAPTYIYFEADSQPSEWDKDWVGDLTKENLIWGYKYPYDENGNVEMPLIRFANARDTDGTMTISADNPITLTVEIIGGDSLQVGDQLQLCARRIYWYKDKEEKRYKKWKLRKQIQYTITKSDLGKRFLGLQLQPDESKWLFYNDRSSASGYLTLSPMYLRIKRVTKVIDNGKECDATFSNVVTVWKTYCNNETISIK